MTLKLQIARLANALGYSVIRRSTFDTLQRESWLLREQSGEAAALRRQLAFLAAGQSELAMSFARTEQDAAAGNGLYTPIYDYVGLRTDPGIIHNHDFMRDTRFVAAYRRGIAAALSDQQAYWRVHVALWCASLAMRLNGCFVECGVWRGLLTSAIMNYFDWNACDRNFYLFDTFRGIDERQLSDEEIAKGNIAHFRREHQKAIFDEVVQNFSEFKNVSIIRGSVPETLKSIKIAQVCYLSLDMNNAAPEIAAATYFWDRLVAGAPILLDDYGWVTYEVQKRAFDKWASERNVTILALPTGQGLIIKPPS
jgi:Macrocin-O-methyltransferase (TylF)